MHVGHQWQIQYVHVHVHVYYNAVREAFVVDIAVQCDLLSRMEAM